jgi:cell volume regulation protein A
MVSWVGLRGAVPIVLATFPLLAGLPKSEIIFDLVFFIVLTSILLQGTSLPLFARWLKVESPVQQKVNPLELDQLEGLDSELVDVDVPAGSKVIGKQIVQSGFPKGALIVLIGRGKEFIVPNGGTVIEGGDRLLILGNKDDQAETRKIVSGLVIQGLIQEKI